jgi:energy-coupling factor transporter transmembrane protein EcfT
MGAVTPAGRLFRVPAMQAVLIQLFAVAPTLAGAYVLARLHHPLSFYGAALLQGALAALLTYFRGLAPWWHAIQLLFPVALLGAISLHLPPPVLLSIFLFLLLLFWSTFRTQVPFYPSGRAVWQAVAALLPPDRPVRLIDIGSGLGGLALDVARRRPRSELSGIELAPLPWILSVLRARLTGSTAHFMRGDYERLDFADYDVVFAYLSPAAMGALWSKATSEMRPATMLVSYEFSIPAKAPDKTVVVTPFGPPLYVWYL